MNSVVNMNDARRRSDLARDFTALKLAALDQALVDPRLTNLDFRVLYYLASAADRHTQIARRKQEVIADALGVTRRSVQVCAERISEFGYIVILTKDGGSYTNGYQLVLTKANVASPIENTKTNPASPYAEKRRSRSSKKAKQADEKGEAPFAPIFPLRSLDIPSLAQGPISPCGLGPAGEQIQRKIGADKYISWFANVRLVSDVSGIVTLSAPSKFIRDWIIQEYQDQMLSAWRAISPDTQRVNVITKEATA